MESLLGHVAWFVLREECDDSNEHKTEMFDFAATKRGYSILSQIFPIRIIKGSRQKILQTANL
jgi:hypothetical protein